MMERRSPSLRKYSLLSRVFVVLMIVVMVAACSPSVAPAQPPAAPKPPAVPSSTQAESAKPDGAPTANAGEPVSGGTLRVGLYEDLNGLVPGSGGGGWVMFVLLDGLYDALLEYDQEMRLQPGLAEKWELENDNKTLVLHLRKGVKFHDGTPFNAEAVKFNLERFIKPKGIVVFDFTKDVESVVVVDEYTVKVNLKAPNNAFIYNLTQDPGQIVSPTAYREKGEEWMSQHPVGTGPFMIESWEAGTEIVYVKNPDYWREGLPYLDKIVWRILKDSTVRTISLTTDQIDLEVHVPPKDAGTLKESPDIDLWVQPGGVCMATFNHTRPPFNKRENRAAVMAAIDYQAIQQTVFYGLADLPTGGNMPSGMWPFNTSLPRLQRDVAKAKDLLAKAGNPQGFKIDLIYEPGDIGQQQAEVIQANLAEVGIQVEVVKTELARFLEVMRSDRNAHDMMLYCHGRMRVNPEEYYTREWSCNGSQNFAQWCNDDFDNLVIESQRTFDYDQRKALYWQIEDMYIKELPGFSVTYPPFIHATNKRVQNYSIHPAGEMNYRWLWLKP